MEKSNRHISRRGFLWLAAAATAGAWAAACAPKAGDQPPEPVSKEPVKITFMSLGGETEQEMFKESLDVAKEQPAVQEANIEIEWQPDPGGGWDKIMSMFAAGTAYDVQRIDDDRVATLALEAKVHQLDCWMIELEMDKDAYYPLFWRTINLGGYQFCMNPACGADVVYYNKGLFEEAGVDMPPTSWADSWEWDEFVALCEKLSKKDASGKPTQYALGFPTNVSTPIAHGAGGTFMNEEQTQCMMDDPKIVAAMDQFVQLTVPGGPEYFVPMGLDKTELFNAGRLAMNWASMGFQNNISEDIEWDICPWPKTPIHAMTENYDRTFVVSKSAPHPKEAFVLLKTITEMPTIDVFSKYKFGVPYLKEAAEGPVFNDDKPPQHKNIWIETMGDVNGNPVDVPTPRGPAHTFKNVFTDETLFGAALSGQMSTQEFLTSGCAQSEAELAGWNWRAGMFEERLREVGALTCDGTKIWPETAWP
jgi:multiple sugar transport system substrate-binding protein